MRHWSHISRYMAKHSALAFRLLEMVGDVQAIG